MELNPVATRVSQWNLPSKKRTSLDGIIGEGQITKFLKHLKFSLNFFILPEAVMLEQGIKLHCFARVENGQFAPFKWIARDICLMKKILNFDYYFFVFYRIEIQRHISGLIRDEMYKFQLQIYSRLR